MDLHTDDADILGLVCLRKAKEGGENQVVSAVAAFNKLLDTDPDGERRHLRRLWLESKAWGDARPAAMATILKTVRKHWNTGVGIEMWDDEA